MKENKKLKFKIFFLISLLVFFTNTFSNQIYAKTIDVTKTISGKKI